MKRATVSPATATLSKGDFNPRPHEEGDPAVNKANMGEIIISIHALMKRATSFGSLDIERLNISIHALMKRATSEAMTDCVFLNNFNPRPHEEGDAITRDGYILQTSFQSTPS